MSKRSDLADFGSNLFENVRGPNLIINGNFDIWQRNITQTSSGYGSADRWGASVSGAGQAMPTVARQSFTSGQTEVPGNPKYFSRFTFTGIAVSTGAITCYSKIENVSTLSGKTVTLSFWAKSSVDNTVIAPDVVQMFGTGGTPSNNVDNYTYATLSTYWKKFTYTLTLPSISGKTLGTNGDHSTTVLFWLSCGNGQGPALVPTQSASVDLAQVQLEEGNFATVFEHRHPGTELRLCQRYFEKSYSPNDAPGTVTTYARGIWSGSKHQATLDLRDRAGSHSTFESSPRQP